MWSGFLIGLGLAHILETLRPNKLVGMLTQQSVVALIGKQAGNLYYSDIAPADRLFGQQFVYAYKKENVKDMYYQV